MPAPSRGRASSQSTKSAFAFYEDLDVEVAGIEPASDDVGPGLLRVQSAVDFLSPHDHADKTWTGSVG